jgi:rare lipoprotein A
MRAVVVIAAGLMLTACAGQMPSGGGGVKASYYNSGSRTASGERFNKHGLTAAHRTLPFGTRVLVQSVKTGRSIVVRINDRGPARWTGKDIDLSEGAARAIGMGGSETIHMSVVR